MDRDYYEVLGVSKNADEAEIKKAYRRVAMRHHPDRNPDDSTAEKKFKEAKQAYEILSNPQKRAAYDQFGHQGVNAAGAGGAHAGGTHGFNVDIEDIFGDFFGGDIFGSRQRTARHRSGEDLEYGIELTLEEAVKGKEQHIQVKAPQVCGTCHGSGAKPGAGKKSCGTCQGSGTLRSQQGFFSIQQTCPTCRGAGTIIAEVCGKCGGAGRTQKTKKLAVNIPAGVDTGDRIRLSGEGGAGINGGPAGDLYIAIRMKPHRLFKRNDHHLLMDVPIAFTTATLGGEIKVPSLKGQLKLKIPAGTQTGKQFRMRGKGMPSARGHGIGDMFCTVHIETPVHLTEEQKDMLEKLDATLHSGEQKHSPKTHGWMENVKKFFTGLGVF